MKIKLFNGITTALHLNILGGGYDRDIGRVQLIVRGDGPEAHAGTILLDPTEAHRLVALIEGSTPKPERVEVAASALAAGAPAASEGAGIHQSHRRRNDAPET